MPSPPTALSNTGQLLDSSHRGHPCSPPKARFRNPVQQRRCVHGVHVPAGNNTSTLLLVGPCWGHRVAAASSLLGCWIQYEIFSSDILSSAWGQDKTWKYMKFHLEKHLFYCEGYQTLNQVSLRGDGVSISGDAQNPTGNGPGLPVFRCPCLSRGVD